MSFVSKSIEEMKQFLLELPEVKRVHELEHYIDTNQDIQDTFNAMKSKQKQLVTAKEFHQIKQAKIYQEEYEVLKSRLLDMPFVEEYFELLEYLNVMFKNIALDIQDKLNHIIA